MSKTVLLWFSTVSAFVVCSSIARAIDVGAPAPTPIAPFSGFNFFSGAEYHVQGDGGIIGNPANPTQGLNHQGFDFGSLYEDHANTPILNQILLTVTKPVDPAAKGYALGFTLEGLYGSDLRFNHFLGIGDQFLGADRNQLNIVQAHVAAHLPWFTTAGIDLRVGLFTSPQGYEGLDSSKNPFYSHSYTDFYATTFNHAGFFSTTHVSPTFDLHFGVDTGNQTSFGFPGGDPNGKPAGFAGFGFNNLLDGKLTVFALSHIGPEQNFISDPSGAAHDVRFYDDVVVTYKLSNALSYVTEVNYTRDAHGFGNGPAISMSLVQWLAYTLTDTYTLNFRAEVLRDSQNFFVSTPQDDAGFVKSEHGTFALTAPTLVAPNGTQGTTYSEVSLGVTIKPDVPKTLALVLLRPEIRYDRIVAGAPAFNNNTSYGGNMTGSRGQFTFGGDIVVGF